MQICLDSPDVIPSSISSRLAEFHHVFVTTNSWDSARKWPGLAGLEIELEHYLRNQQIAAYHCTKEPRPGFFKQRGLRLTDLKAHQEQFLNEYGHLFSEAEVATMRFEWEQTFHRNPRARLARNSVIWVCLTKTLANSQGVAPFFTYFGGEAIYWSVLRHAAIAEKLARIGEPVIVEVSIPAKNLLTYGSLAEFVLSRHHHRINPQAPALELEGRIVRPIPPDEVMQVVALSRFQTTR